MNERILIVDDEKEIADLVEIYLLGEGYTVEKFYNGADALECISTQKLDMAILDVMLPDADGFSICRKIRENHNYPVIMLTAKVEDIDKINGLAIGADDYITKPFNPLELVARVKAQLRRYTRYNTHEQIKTAVYDSRGLIVNLDTHECFLFGKEINLTPTEFKILWLLCENKGRAVILRYKLEQLFKKLFLADSARRSSTGGSGMGLAIAKQIAELHKGEIYAESEKEYTEFRVVLPTNI